jgi:hypothetical protein
MSSPGTAEDTNRGQSKYVISARRPGYTAGDNDSEAVSSRPQRNHRTPKLERSGEWKVQQKCYIRRPFFT